MGDIKEILRIPFFRVTLKKAQNYPSPSRRSRRIQALRQNYEALQSSDGSGIILRRIFFLD